MALTQISTQGIKDGTITGSDLATNVDLVDNQKIRFGTGNDLEIIHNSSENHFNFSANTFFKGNSAWGVRNSSNQNILQINGTNRTVELYGGSRRVISTASAKLTVRGGIEIEDSEFNMTTNGNKILDFETGGTNHVNFRHNPSDASLSTFMKAIHGGAVELYHDADGSKKFETDSIGVKLEDNNHVSFGTGSDFKIHFDGSNAYLDANAGNVYFRGNSNEAMLQLHQNGGVELYHDNTKRIETTSYGARVFGNFENHDNFITVKDAGKFTAGNSDDLQIYHQGTVSRIQDVGVGGLEITSDGTGVDINKGTSEYMGRFITDGGVELYYNNSKKFETVTGGVYVYGDLVAGVGGTGNFSIGDSQKIMAGNGNDLQIYHDGTNSVIAAKNTGDLQIFALADDILLQAVDNIFIKPQNGESGLNVLGDGAVELFYDNSKKLETTANGFNTQGSGQVEVIIGSTNAGGAVLYLDGDSDGDASGGANYAYIFHNTAGALLIRNRVNQAIHFGTNDTERWYVYDAGHFVPAANNTYDIGTSSVRVRNIYTNDLNLSNEGGSNDVDGTWGSYTIQEGEESLFLINKRNGKKYKFNLTEVS